MRFCNERGITGTVAALHCIIVVYVLFIDIFIYLLSTSVCNGREELIDGSPDGVNLLFYLVLSCFWTVAGVLVFF